MDINEIALKSDIRELKDLILSLKEQIMPKKESSGLLDVPEGAAYANMAESTMWLKIRLGEIPSYKIGKRRMVKIVDIDRYIESLRQKSNAEIIGHAALRECKKRAAVT